MRIGIDGMPLAQPRTGVGVYTYELARALAAAGPQDEFELVSPLPFEPSLAADDKPANLELVYSKPNVIQRHWWTLGLPSYIRRRAFEIFHGTNYEVPLRQHCPAVVTIHDLSLLLHSNTHEARAARRARVRLPLMARKATLVITPSETVRDEVIAHLKINPENVFAIPLAPRSLFQPIAFAETAATRARLGVEDEFLLFVGTIEPRKNLSTLLLAFEELVGTTGLQTQLVIAGRVGWKQKELLARLKNSPVRERVNLTGFVSDEDLRVLYSSCRAFVYPSLYEGFGLPPLEAMACGAPVIASREVPSVNETAVRLVAPYDDRELALAIVDLLTDDEARSALVSAGPKHARKFSWERTARMTREVYAAALQK